MQIEVLNIIKITFLVQIYKYFIIFVDEIRSIKQQLFSVFKYLVHGMIDYTRKIISRNVWTVQIFWRVWWIFF